MAYEITVENTGKVAMSYMNRILENRKKEAENGENKPPKAYPKKAEAAPSPYDFDAIERQAFLNVNKEDGEDNHGA